MNIDSVEFDDDDFNPELFCAYCGNAGLYHTSEEDYPGDYYVGNPYGCNRCFKVFHIV